MVAVDSLLRVPTEEFSPRCVTCFAVVLVIVVGSLAVGTGFTSSVVESVTVE